MSLQEAFGERTHPINSMEIYMKTDNLCLHETSEVNEQDWVTWNKVNFNKSVLLIERSGLCIIVEDPAVKNKEFFIHHK